MKRQPDGRQTTRGLRDVLLTILLLAVVFAAWRFVFSSAAGGLGGPSASPLPTATPTVPEMLIPLPVATANAISTKIARQIVAEETLRSPAYTPDVTPDWARLRSDMATRAARPRPTQALFSAYPAQKPAGAGWLGQMLPMFYNHGFGVTNTWSEYGAGGILETDVIAGAYYGDPARALPGPQGLVVVQVRQMDQDRLGASMTYQKLFLTPTASGEVTITGAQGERLILQSTDGTTFYFDLPTRQFVPSLAATVTAPPPTTGPVSPLATGTPVP
jgi:hypothetical protein